MTKTRSRALGRGLEALIPLATGWAGERADGGIPQLVPVDQVRPSPGQTRRSFEAGPLRELADSIREHGVLQPILVRRLADGYELIAGERRWRAARMAGLDRLPALVRATAPDEQQSLLLGLVENLQREDLDPIAEARGIQRLIEQFGLTHEGTAARIGKHRVAVSQALRLLQACPALLSATAAGAISAGHARALVGLPSAADQETGLKVVLARQLSVRQTERWVRSYRPAARPIRRAAADLAELGELARALGERLGTAVSIAGTLQSGRISIRYRGRLQLERVCRELN
jgi:ParB family chromosome partitioning protein